MAKKITIPYNGKTYVLEYTRKTVSIMERQGFVLSQLADKPATMIPLLFNGAFLVNHGNTKNEVKDAVFNSLNDRSKLVQTLTEMYHEAYSVLLDDGEDDEGNPGWEVTE